MNVIGRAGPLDASVLDGAEWRTSRRSEEGHGNCVEVAPLIDGGVAVRHSTHPDAAVIVYTRAEWDAFIAGAKNREFDF